MSREPVFPSDVLPGLGAWTTDVSNLLYTECTLLQSILVARSLWPTFIEVEGHVIREEAFTPDGLRHWREATGNDRRAVESVLNHVHVSDLFKSDEQPQDALEYFAQIMARTWKAALAEQHPDRTFEVEYTPGPDAHGPIVCVWQATEGEAS